MKFRSQLIDLALAAAMIALAAGLWLGVFWLVPLELVLPRPR